jgi:hypothetical protein
MSTPITDAANAISNQSPAIKHFAQLVAARLEPPAPVPVPVPTFGGSLPPRMVEATGPIVAVSTLAALENALATAAPGTRIRVAGGIYGAGDADALSVATQGTAAAPVQVEPQGATVTLAKLLKLTGGVTRLRGLTVAKNAYPTDARFGKPAVPGGGNVGLWIDCPTVELDGCTISGATMSGVFGMGDYVQLWNSHIVGNGTSHDDHGVYWGQGGVGALVANCLITDNACFGFQIQYNSRAVTVANCTIAENGKSFAGSGTVQAADARYVRYVNCISVDNGEVGFKSYTSGVGNVISHCLAHGNQQGPTYGTFDSVTNLLTADPLLDVNLRPQAGSPVIGSGDPAWCPPFDIDGTVRKVASMGCYA